MINNKTIAVVVPAYNEESQIGMVIDSMPDFVDRIIVVNDKSTDKTFEIVANYIKNNTVETKKIESVFDKIKPSRYNNANVILLERQKQELDLFFESEVFNKDVESDRIILISNKQNSGVGASIARGYKWAKDYGIDCTAVMAGDGQMDPDELIDICEPVINENIDYVKGNRLIHHSALLVIPRMRFLGNSILSILTKLASGYWHVSDTQTGYTAISKKAINSIKLFKIYKSYGYPNDLLVKLNIAFCNIKEVEIKPIYNIGESSKMKIHKVIPRISWLLFRSFFKRLWIKYLFRDFHPLFLLYHIAFVLFIYSIPFLVKILNHAFVLNTDANPVTVLAFVFLFISASQSLLFAMWMDIQDNDRLYR